MVRRTFWISVAAVGSLLWCRAAECAGDDPAIHGPESAKRQMAYNGTVVDYVTGEPIAGAWMALARLGYLREEDFTDEEVRRLYAELEMGESADLTDEAWQESVGLSEQTRRQLNLRAIARADAQGHYRILHPPGEHYHYLSVWSPGFTAISMVPVSQGPSRPPRLENEVETAALLPTARVRLRAFLPEGVEFRFEGEGRSPLDVDAFRINFRVLYEGPEIWSYHPGRVEEWPALEAWAEHGPSSHQSVPGEEVELTVPAEWPIRIVATAPMQPKLTYAEWDFRTKPLERGIVHEVEPRTIEVGRPVIVRVVDLNGEPLPGIKIRLEISGRAATDENGEMVVWSHKQKLGKLIVQDPRPTFFPLFIGNDIPIPAPGPEEEHPVVLIRTSVRRVELFPLPPGTMQP